MVTELLDATREALSGSLLVVACEIQRAQIAVWDLVAQQIIGSSKDRGDWKANGTGKIAADKTRPSKSGNWPKGTGSVLDRENRS
jgi:hypothetical protein